MAAGREAISFPVGGIGSGVMHMDAAGVCSYVTSKVTVFSDETHLYHDAFYDSNIPRWFSDCISSQVVLIRTVTA
jgi:uncharacterized protein (DUF608 family)